jgi:hypothetical protein
VSNAVAAYRFVTWCAKVRFAVTLLFPEFFASNDSS